MERSGTAIILVPIVTVQSGYLTHAQQIFGPAIKVLKRVAKGFGLVVKEIAFGTAPKGAFNNYVCGQIFAPF